MGSLRTGPHLRLVLRGINLASIYALAYEAARPHGASYLPKTLYLGTELTFQPWSKQGPPWLSSAVH